MGISSWGCFEQPQEEITMFIFLKLVIKLYIATCTIQQEQQGIDA